MKKNIIKTALLFILSLICIALFVSCQKDEIKTYRVMIADGEGYTVSGNKYFDVEKNGTVQFDVAISEGYYLESLSQGAYVDGKVVVNNVRYGSTIDLRVKEIAQVTLNASGGEVELVKLGNSDVFLVGEYVDILFSVDSRYEEAKISINGVEIESQQVADTAARKATTMLTSNLDITATAVPQRVNVDIGDCTGANVSIKEPQEEYRYFDEVVVCLDLQEGYDTGYAYINETIHQFSEAEEYECVLNGDLSVNVYCRESEKELLLFNANGGSFSGGEVYCESSPQTISYYLPHFYKTLTRDGYTLVGVNTAADGSGTHHALGAMLALDGNDTEILYAEWAKWSDNSLFSYSENADGTLSIDGVNSESAIPTLVIPEKIDGKTVSRIAANAISENESITELVIPPSVITLESKAVASMTALQRIVMFDSMRTMAKDSFFELDALSSLRINAATDRVWEKVIEMSYVDKQMRLKTIEGKKIVTISGCSYARGLMGSLLKEDPYFDEYGFINMGVHAGYGLYFLLETIEPYLSNGDVVVFAPEYRDDMYGTAQGGSIYQIFYICESNYDLLDDIDFSIYKDKLDLISYLPKFFSTKHEYLDGNAVLPVSYTRQGSVDEYGFFTYYRQSSIEAGITLSKDNYGAVTYPSLIGEGMEAINAFAERVAAKGVTCYFSFPPTYKYDEFYDEAYVEMRAEFMAKLDEKVDCQIIGSIEDSSLEAEWMCNTVNHCSTDGSVVFTERFVDTLKAQMQLDEQEEQ